MRPSYLFIALTALITGVTGCERESLYGGSDFSRTSTTHSRTATKPRSSDSQWPTTSRRPSDAALESLLPLRVVARWNPSVLPVDARFAHPERRREDDHDGADRGSTSGAAWLSPEILAIPLPAAEGKSEERIAIYNRAAAAIEMRGITVSHPADLTPYQSGLLFTALDDEETDARTPWISTRETSHGPFHG